MKTVHLSAFALLFVGACTSDPRLVGEASALDLTRVEVEDSASALRILGFDAEDAQIAELQLASVSFVRQDDGRAVVGRQMTIRVLGREVTHESEGFDTLKLPLLVQADLGPINAFVVDARVKPVLEAYGVTFAQRSAEQLSAPATPSREVAFWGCTHASNPACGQTSCSEGDAAFCNDSEYCGNPTGGVEETVCCGSSKLGIDRYCGLGSANPCGTEGPAGCAVCWSVAYSSSCTTWEYPWELTCTDYGTPNGHYYDTNVPQLTVN